MQQDYLPELPLNYSDIQLFCKDILPLVAKYVNSPYVLRKLLFSNKGWQLSDGGTELLTDTFKSYKSKHQNNRILTGKILINMDICCNSPWNLHNGTVTLFDQMLHFELQMVNGDLDTFINFKSVKY